MTNVSVTKRVEAPVGDVFAAFTDLENAAENVQGIVAMEILTDGPIGIGTRFRETRVMFGKKATEVMEIVAFDPGKAYRVKANSCGNEYLSEFRFEPKDGGTEVTMSFNAKPITFMAKLMSPLGKLLVGTMTKCIEQDMTDMKGYAEGGGQTAAAAG